MKIPMFQRNFNVGEKKKAKKKWKVCRKENKPAIRKVGDSM